MFRSLFTLVLCFLVVLLLAPFPALAQEVAAEVEAGGLARILAWFSTLDVSLYVLIALAAVELAKRVCAVIPGEEDDKIVNSIERGLRKLIDFIAGKTRNPADPSLIVRE